MWPNTLGVDFALENSLFGAISLTKKAYPDKYKYSGYSIGYLMHIDVFRDQTLAGLVKVL